MANLHTPNKTPSKFLENLTREVRESVHRKTNSSSSPFYFLPNNLTTPPSRFIKIRNPFEAAINDQLHKQIFSPSVFAEVQNPRNSDKFKWTIEEVSTIRPAHIDTSSMAQFEHSTTEDDVHVQAKIEKYFSETHIVPSPFNQDSNQAPLLPEDSTTSPKSFQETKQSCNVWTQTVLSLPPKLPEALEKALLPYFSFTEDQRRQTVDLNSSLCRRLFHFEAETDESTVSSVHSEISVIGSPLMDQQDSDKRKRTFDSSPESDIIPAELSPIPCSTPRKLNNCEISPITLNMSHIQCRAAPAAANESLSPIALTQDQDRTQSFSKADFSGHMSVDNSFNLAPENDFTSGNQTHLSESPVRSNEFMDASCNWDLEYNNVSLNVRPARRSLFESRNEKMDISNLTTPKSKIINSQRKKLSDSFKFNESLNDDDLLLDYEEKELKFRKLFHEKLEDSSKHEELSQDTGYSTELSQKSNVKDEELVMDTNEKEIWNTIYASTPSKRYFSEVGK